jgi:putative transposase
VVRSRVSLHVEIIALRHQLAVVNRSRRPPLGLTAVDRMLWSWLSYSWRGWRSAIHIVKPETVLAWHRRGFRLFWTWKSRHRTGRPAVPHELRALIREMSTENPLWGAPPRIHGELQKLGITVSESTVAKYMRRHPRPSSQTWRTFLTNHASQIMAADLFVVPTVTFRLLFVLVISRTTVDGSSTWRSRRIRQRPGRHNNFAMHFQRTTFPDISFTIEIRSLQTCRQPSLE